MIVITHRENLLQMVDQVYRVEKGRMVVEERSHPEMRISLNYQS